MIHTGDFGSLCAGQMTSVRYRTTRWLWQNVWRPIADSPVTVAECLADFEEDHDFKFIEKLKCAISTFMELLYGHDASSRISKHPVIVSQIAGSRKTQPSKPRYDKDDAWHVGLIRSTGMGRERMPLSQWLVWDSR